ncbi:retrovirus-related pol polyprotein from transposon TNT 1-94 [Tanacetum coccineum]
MASTRASISKASKRPKINIIPPKQLFVDLTHDDTKTPSPTLQLSSPSAPNAPSKTPSTKDTSSSSIDYIPKSPTSSTSLSPNGYLNPPTSPPPRVSPPPPTQENASMDITLTLSPITPLDVQFDTPSPSPPILGHPIPWNLLEAHGDSYSSSSDVKSKSMLCRKKNSRNSSRDEEDLCGDPNHLIGECSKPPKNNDQREFIGGAWSDNGEDEVGKTKDETCLVAQAPDEICLGVNLEPDEWIKDSGCSKHHDRTDHGREFDNEVQFGNYCDLNGISHNFSAPRTPQSNGVVERKNRTLQEMSRTMLNEQSIPQKFWCNAVDTSTYIINRVSIRRILGKTPYELLRGRKPNLNYFRVFGSKCFVLNTKDYLTKFDPKSYEGVFLGYSQNSKAYIILNKQTMKVEESLNVTFDETPPPPKTSPLEDDELVEEEAIEVSKTKPIGNNLEDISLENNQIVNIKESKTHPLENVIGNLNQRTLRSQAQDKRNFFCFISTIEPKNINEALKDENWVMPMQEELNQFKINDVWELVPNPMDMTIIGTKWVYRNKLDENGVITRNKAREVYVAQPLGFIDFAKPNYVYKLKKALYGLKQAPKAWYDRLKAFLIKHNYSMGMVDNTLFTKKKDSNLIIVQIYVDDIIFGSTCQEMCDDFAKIMHDEFEMSMMGELNFFLGLQIKQLDDGIFFNQSKYIKEMLKKFGLEDSKPIKTPMSTETKLTRDEEGESVDNTKYRGMIGSLLYLTASRPDIMFSVCLCARFQEDPKTSHLEAVKRIFRYIKGTTHLGLWYPKGSGIETTVYADSDHAGDYVDHKSTSGVCTFMGCCLTSWFSKKQTALDISTTEAEYVSDEKACQQALWMKKSLIDYGVRLDDIPIMCDNKRAIDLRLPPVEKQRSECPKFYGDRPDFMGTTH